MAIDENQVVSIQYELRDVDNGEILDSNIEAAPLSFIVGKGQIIPGLEDEIKKLSLNDSEEVRVSAKDAYGEYDEKAVQTLPKEQFAGLELKEGMTLYGQGEDGGTVQVTVKSFDDENVNVDFNHPLAGKDLLFALSVVEVRDATAQELIQGYVGAPEGGGCGCGTGDSCHTAEDDSHSCSC
ncbi:MAG: peptidylprolyl isomerase [Sulfurospirillum sp.]